MGVFPFEKLHWAKRTITRRQSLGQQKEHKARICPQALPVLAMASSSCCSHSHTSLHRDWLLSQEQDVVYMADWHKLFQVAKCSADYSIHIPPSNAFGFLPLLSTPDQACYRMFKCFSIGCSNDFVCIFLNINDVEPNSMCLTRHSWISLGEPMPNS